MSKGMDIGRRQFLKTSAAGAAGTVLAGGIVNGIAAATSADVVWVNGFQINPDIDNLRVVYAMDPAMIKIPESESMSSFLQKYCSTDMAKQVDYTDKDLVQKYMDWMACALLEPKFPGIRPKEAWAKIFRSGKPWADTRVAMKMNCRIFEFVPKLAIIDKVCKELIALGVKPENIVIFDRVSVSPSQPIDVLKFMRDRVGTDLPTGIKVSDGNALLGGEVDINVPGYSNARCTADIANGKIDILVNIARNQEHSREYGWFTGCVKNHYGTCSSIEHGNVNYMVLCSKHNAIIGGTPPRQQLCIIDALVGSKPGARNSLTPPDRRTNMLVMGTCGPIVDYQVVYKIRKPLMDVEIASDYINKFVTQLGYTTSDPQWIEATMPRETHAVSRRSSLQDSRIELSTTGRYRPARISIDMPRGNNSTQLRIFDMHGKCVRSFTITPSGNHHVVWDCRADNGKTVGSGSYAVSVISGAAESGGTVILE
jgi:hypothetical protein